MAGLTVIDPACVSDIFCEGICQIDKVGENFRLTMYVARDLGDKYIEHMVVARTIFPREVMANVIKQMENALKGVPFMNSVKAADESESTAIN